MGGPSNGTIANALEGHFRCLKPFSASYAVSWCYLIGRQSLLVDNSVRI